MTEWIPARLPDGYVFDKSRLIDSRIVVRARKEGQPSKIFVRNIQATSFDELPVSPAEDVLDLEYLPNAGGAYVLTATKTAGGWSELRVSLLNLAPLRLDPIYSADEWRDGKGVFPAAFLGSTGDGRKIALACGEAHAGAHSTTVRYRVGLLDGQTGALVLGETLVGIFF